MENYCENSGFEDKDFFFPVVQHKKIGAEHAHNSSRDNIKIDEKI
jgi:hypothetical protein